MMLRKRSRAVGSKQSIMGDSQPLTSSADAKHSKPTAVSLFASPRILVGLSPRSWSDHEPAMSPTSTLETRHFSNSIAVPRNSHLASVVERKHSKPVCLGILDALNDSERAEEQSSKAENRMVLFSSRLKIQIPCVKPKFSVPVGCLEFPSSPIEFGIKNKDSQLALFSPAPSTLSAELPVVSPQVLSESIPVSEMELSEDYTRVISHGPNPKTTHIFDNCILECCGDGFTPSKKAGTPMTDCKCFPASDSLGCWGCTREEFQRSEGHQTV